MKGFKRLMRKLAESYYLYFVSITNNVSYKDYKMLNELSEELIN